MKPRANQIIPEYTPDIVPYNWLLLSFHVANALKWHTNYGDVKYN